MSTRRAVLIVERWLIPTLAAVSGIFLLVALLVWVAIPQETKPLEYTPQVIERIEDDGSITVPLIQGFAGPAVRLGDTVPVRGVLTVTADKPIDLSGSVVWEQVPPGRREVVIDRVASNRMPGRYDLVFENEIPEAVAELVRDAGPTKWVIKGTVDVLEPNSVGSTFETSTFWLVP